MNYAEMKKLMSKQKEEMTETERLKSYFAGEEVEYLPYSLLGAELAYANIFGYTAKEYVESFEVKCDIIGKLKEEFGFYSYNVDLGLKIIGVALGSKLSIPENGMDYIDEYVLNDYADIDKLKIVDPYNNPVLSQRLEDARRIKEVFPDITISTSVAGPFSTAAAIRPVERILRDTRKDPESLYKLLDLSVACSLKWIEVFQKEFGNIGTGFADPVTCMDVLSYKQFKEHSLPFIKKQVDGTKKIVGTSPSSHICGRTKAIWKDLADVGITSFSVDNCEDLEELKLEVGDRLTISGNVPPVDVLKNGSIDDVIEHCKICIEKGSKSPMGFVLSTGCQVPIGTPRENIEAFIYASRKYGRGARKGRLPEGILKES